MRKNTDYLKGLAIFMIMAGHYFKKLVPGQYVIGGNGFVSIFFVLSGYGLYHSLARQFGKNADLRGLAMFYLRRAKRLYPLYWISLLLWAKLNVLALPVPVLLATDFTDPPFLWFIPAILQCYLLAPFLFLIIQRFALPGLGGLAVVLLALGLAAPGLGVPHERVWVYRDLHFNSIIMFLLGMSIPLLRAQHFLPVGRKWATLFFFLFILIIIQQRFELIALPGGKTLSALLLTATVLFFCASFMELQGPAPLEKIFQRLGVYTYSLYVFHPLYFRFIRTHLPLPDGYAQLLITLAFFPLLIIGGGLLEELCRGGVSPKGAVIAFKTKMFSADAFP